MRKELLEHLKKITEEEQRILEGEQDVNRELYTSGQDFTVDSRKMLEEGKLIAIRTHTRFVDFPAHKHNYIEVLYVCQGSLTNIIDGKEVVIQEGELLFLNQFSEHAIFPAGVDDIAINLMILPEFFDVAYSMAGRNNVLADFLVDVLRHDVDKSEYLYFKVSDVLQIQNLLENLIYGLITGKGDQNRINQTTMGLIFLYLLDSIEQVEMRVPDQYENLLMMTTLEYIDLHYDDATLGELCEILHLPIHTLSKRIHKNTGFNFKELLQRKRLSKAAELLCDTEEPVSEIIAAVGYENNSYFHRVFRERYGMTPKKFREKNRGKSRIRI